MSGRKKNGEEVEEKRTRRSRRRRENTPKERKKKNNKIYIYIDDKLYKKSPTDNENQPLFQHLIWTSLLLDINWERIFITPCCWA